MPPHQPPSAYLIPVSTLTYGGVWVEGAQTASALHFAQTVRARFGWDVAGAVLPANVAAPHGCDFGGHYRWLIRRYSS